MVGLDRARVPRKKPRRVLGLLAAAAVAWTLLVPLPFLADQANALWWGPAWMRHAPWPNIGVLVTFAILMAIVGLPLSLIFCFGFGLPTWLVASRFGMKRLRAAAMVGATLGLVVDIGLAGVRYAAFALVYQRDEPLTKVLFFYPGIGLYVATVGAIAGAAAWWVSSAEYVDRTNGVARVFA